MVPDQSNLSSPADPGPVVTIGNQSGATNDRSQTIAGTLGDAGTTVTGQIVTIEDDGAPIGRAVVRADGAWSTDVLLSNIGSNTLTATTTDATGRSATSDPISLTLDTVLTPPPTDSPSRESGQPLHFGHDAVLSADGGSRSFVFRPHPGHAVVTGLDLHGPERDTMFFPCRSFSSFADLLRHTTMSSGDAVIHLSPSDSVTLVGIGKAELRADRSAFAFHP